MKRLHLPLVLGALLAVVIAACGTEPTPSGPGTASLDIAGTRGDCHSIGGCAYVARLAGPAGQSEANLELALDGRALAPGAGFPPVLTDGDYRIAFELRLMSDEISNDGPRDYGIGATCEAAFKVGPGRSVIMVRATFGVDTCSVSVASEQWRNLDQSTTGRHVTFADAD